jgi:hypothetical protein
LANSFAPQRIESNALNAVQNAGDATANYKLDAGIRQSHKHFLKVIFHSQRVSFVL